MDREAWRATAHEVAKTERVHTRAHTHTDMLKVKVKVTQLCPTFCDPMDCIGQYTGLGSLSLLQGIFLTQESNQGLLHCRQILYQLSYGSKMIPNC